MSRLIVGDCRIVLRSLQPNSISACITDPPYNYEFVGREWQHEEIRRRLKRARAPGSSTLVRNIPYGSGLAGGVRNERWYERNRQNADGYQAWTEEWAAETLRVLRPGAYISVMSSTRSAGRIQVALESVGFYSRDMMVYRRRSGIPKGLNGASKLRQTGGDFRKWIGWHSALRSEWEAIVLAQKPLTHNYLETMRRYGTGLMKVERSDGSFLSNIIEDVERDPLSSELLHCTPKPVDLMRRMIDLLLPPGDEHVVLDPFAGSGSTLVAAETLGRGWLGIEIEPEYVSVAERRLAALSHHSAR